MIQIAIEFNAEKELVLIADLLVFSVYEPCYVLEYYSEGYKMPICIVRAGGTKIHCLAAASLTIRWICPGVMYALSPKHRRPLQT